MPGKRKPASGVCVFRDVYVLTSADSFSSAMDFATLLITGCVWWLERLGNMPSSYGDISISRRRMRCLSSRYHKYFIRPDASKSDVPLIPDVQVPADAALEEVEKIIGANIAHLNGPKFEVIY